MLGVQELEGHPIPPHQPSQVLCVAQAGLNSQLVKGTFREAPFQWQLPAGDVI